MKIDKKADGTVILTIAPEEVPGFKSALAGSASRGKPYEWSRLTPGGVGKTAYELLNKEIDESS